MSTATTTLPTAPSLGAARNLRIFATEIRFEFIRALRTRAFSLSSIGFPVMFYTLFGLVMNHGEMSHGISTAKYMLGGYAVFGMMGAALFGIGVGLSGDITAGWMELKRASPMPPLAYLLAKCTTAISFSLIIVTLLCALGVTFGHAPLSLPEYLRMLAVTVAGAVPFSALGMVLALLVPTNAVPAVVNMIYLPMSFLSGLWIPVMFLPRWLQAVAPLMPTYHLSQLMLSIYGYQDHSKSLAGHWLNLAGFALVALGVAAIAFRRREQNS